MKPLLLITSTISTSVIWYNPSMLQIFWFTLVISGALTTLEYEKSYLAIPVESIRTYDLKDTVKSLELIYYLRYLT
jgi:hypothetical protein